MKKKLREEIEEMIEERIESAMSYRVVNESELYTKLFSLKDIVELMLEHLKFDLSFKDHIPPHLIIKKKQPEKPEWINNLWLW